MPHDAFYNPFHNFICVHTNERILLFSLMDGSLIQVHLHIFIDDPIDMVRQDAQFRKIYVTSRSGTTKVLNIQNGTCLFEHSFKKQIKKIKQKKTEDSDSEELTNHVEKNGLSDMQLVQNDDLCQLFIVEQNTLSVYQDGEQDGGEFTFLRSVTGGHQKPITHIRFDYHLSLFATANEVGEIAIWDYESS